MASYISIYAYTRHGDTKMTDINIQIRVNGLKLNSLRAALFSIEDAEVQEKAINAGESYQELTEKIGRKEKA